MVVNNPELKKYIKQQEKLKNKRKRYTAILQNVGASKQQEIKTKIRTKIND